MATPVFPSSLPGFSVNVTREPITAVETATAASGRELRSTWQQIQRFKYAVAFDLLRGTSKLEAQTLWDLFTRSFGQLQAFLFTDPDDNAVSGHGFGTGNGATTSFQLQRQLPGFVSDATGATWPKVSTQRTNLLLQSQFFSTSWSASGTGVTNNAELAPDGTTTANALTGVGTLRQVIGSSTGGNYTLSCWVRAPAGVSGTLAILDTSASNAVVASVPFVGAAGSGWTRISVTGAPLFGHTFSAQLALSTSGTAYAWGAQIETGAAATAYIVTTSAAVTIAPSFWPQISDGFEPIYDLNFAGSLFAVYVGGTLKQPGTDYNVSSSGLVTFASAPASNAQLTWSGSFYRRVRFADASIKTDRIVSGWYEAKQINLQSVIGS